VIDDRGARERALDPNTSFIVQAPAGSGKTELLIQRYLRLLVEVPAPEAVVAITFTKKAAAEMLSRVMEALRMAASGAIPSQPHRIVTHDIARAVLEQDRRFSWNLLSNPSRLRIGTINALALSITSRMPWLARFGALPEITEKAEDLYHEAAQNTLRRLEREERNGELGPVSRLLLHLDNNFGSAEMLIAEMLEKRDQWLRHTGATPHHTVARANLERSFQKLIVSELEKLHALFDEPIAREIIAVCDIAGAPGSRSSDLERWRAMANVLLTKSGGLRKQPDNKVYFKTHPLRGRCEALLARLRDDEELIDALVRLRDLPDPHFGDEQWTAMEAVLAVLPVAVAELGVVFRERGIIDFVELSLAALRALGDEDHPTDLGLVLGYRIEHILVDEFQDTSHTQYKLLRKLTAAWEPGDGRTLFFVGDPMQSIYRFRQADVSLFLRARSEGFGNLTLEPLVLSTNFRSRPEIIAWANTTFETIFPLREDADSGAVVYEHASPPEGAVDDASNAVQMHAFFDADAEAERVAALIQAANGKKVGVLVRSRMHLSAIVPALKRTGIRFQAIEIDELGQRPVIQDLMALTFALLHLADRVSWLAILRAPWCGLTLRDLYALAATETDATILELLDRRISELSPDGQARVLRILPNLKSALARRGRCGLRDWVEDTWTALGGPACLVDATDRQDAAAYFDLIEGLEEGADLEDFGWFRKQVSNLFAQPDASAGEALQLMTIHKAKGLEFDVVILPGLGSQTKTDRDPLLAWQEQDDKLLLAPIPGAGQSKDPIYGYLSRLELRKAQFEMMRLLYVAVTRAREQLHLLSTVKVDGSGAIAKPSSKSFLGLLWKMAGNRFIPADSPLERSAEGQVREIRRFTAGWQMPFPPPSAGWRRTPVDPAEMAEVSFDWVGNTLRHIGTAVHAFLRRIAREGVEVWDHARVREHRNTYRTVLANLGVPSRETNGAVDRIESALLQVLRDPRGRWVLDRHDAGESEFEITGILDGQEYRAIIDRTFIDAQGVRWIIDYKSSSHEGSDIEAFLDNEKERYRAQLERYGRLLAHQESRPIRLALYFPLLNGWREWPALEKKFRQASLFEL
jgi:ATP-dependent exoDNAse (exonuclease V) beta subunit